MLAQAVTCVGETDILALHRRAASPVLAFFCTAPARGAIKLLVGSDGTRMLQSYRRGLRADLAQLVEDHPNITVAEIDAPHHVTSTNPQLLADRIAAFTRNRE